MKRVPYPNGKELMTIRDNGETLALYTDSYYYGNNVALLMINAKTGELWGDLTINLPGYGGTYLQDFISDRIIDKLSDVFYVDGVVKCNYGRYRIVEFNEGVLDKIPTYDELCEMLGWSNGEDIPTL